MTDRLALEKLATARDPFAHTSGEDIWSAELRSVVDEFRTPDAATGKPADAFSALALDLLRGKDVNVGGAVVKGIQDAECSRYARTRKSNAAEEARAKL